MNYGTKVTIGFVAGAFFGVSIGLLYAPHSVRARALISKKAKELADQAMSLVNKLKDHFG